MRLLYGTIANINGGRATVRLAGYDDEGSISAILLQPAGGSSVKTWLPPQAGDVVAVLFDDERPEDSAVIGGAYTDSQTPPKSGAVIALQAREVYLGSSMDGIQKATRDDHVQTELDALKSQLDAVQVSVKAFQTALAALGIVIPDDALYINTYSPGATASDSVYVK